MRKVKQKIILIGISVSILLGSLNNVTVADHEQKNILKVNLSNLITQNKTVNEKLEQAVVNLIMHNTRYNNLNNQQKKDFSFIGEKVRLEIILTDEVMLDTLASFSNDIEIENHYKSLAQILIPINQINNLSKENYVQYIRSPVKAIPDIISEGVSVIGANLVQNVGYYGAGVKIAIIDLGFMGYSTNPDLPPSRIKEVISFRADQDIECGEKHGSACAEIVLDVAPQADIYLYNFDTISELNNAVSHAISVGINIISFSVGYVGINDYNGIGYAEYGDVCSIVNHARSHGILFVASSGNEAQKHYEGTFTDGNNNGLHDFGPGVEFLSLGYLPTGSIVHLVLSWNNWPYSNQDYDLYVVNDGGYIVAASENVQDGTQPPVEGIFGFTTVGDNYYVAILKWSATWNVHFELYSFYNNFYTYNHPESSLTCPADTTGAMTVGATYWQNDALESFSSQGPTNDGRTKPDVAAPDGVSTYSYGSGNFYGTSASAPHTAGAAALLKSVDSTLTANQLQTVLETTAVDLGISGKDNLYGSGRINVWNAYNSPIVNKPPIANDDYYTINEDSTLTVIAPGILTNDTDGDSDLLTAIKVTNPAHGTITSFNSNGAFVYVPTTNYFGSDSYTYKTYDGTVYSNIATVHITITSVNDPPIANDDTATVIEDSINNQINVRINDNDVEGDTLTIISVTQPSHGNSSTNGNYVYYTPTANYHGPDLFTYKLNDGQGGNDTATVTITITSVNDPPIANDDYATFIEDSINNQINVRANDTDADGDTLTITSVTQPSHGNSSTNGNYVYYTPTANYHGSVSFTYKISDGQGGNDTATVTITVSSVNDPPIANNDTATVLEDSINNQINVRANDTDVDGDTLTIISVTQPSHGFTSTNGNYLNYTPTANYNGPDSFTYSVSDGHGGFDTAIVNIMVTRVNDPPVANFNFKPINPTIQETVFFNSSSYDSDGVISNYTWDFGDGNISYQQNTVHQYTDNGTYLVTLNVIDNDSATDTNQKTILVSINYPPNTPSNPSPTNGASNVPVFANLSWTGGDPNWDTVTYDVYFGMASSPDKVTSNQSDTTYDPGTVNFTTTYNWKIVAWDTHGANTTSPTWHFTTRTNHPPIANPNSYSTNEDIALTIAAPGVLGNDGDSDGDMLTAVKVSDTTYGSITLNSNGSFSYVPSANYYGIDTFTYKAYDGFVYSTVVNVTITINSVNDPPVFGASSPGNGSTGDQLSLTWSIPIMDIEGDLFSWTIQCSNGQTNSSTGADNGTKTLSLTGLAYSTTYKIWVNSTDSTGSNQFTRKWYTITPKSSGGGGGGSEPPAAPPGPSNKYPISNASAGEPYQGFVNSEIFFDGSRSHDLDGNIIKWFWVFGDKTNGTGKTVPHIYSKVGTYTVTLTVTDNEGATNTDTTTCVITQPNRPPTKPIITGPTSGTKNTMYTYTALSTDADNDTIQYTFNWSEPVSPSSGFLPNGSSFTVNHSWSNAGRYSVTVTVTDNQTESSSNITVYIDAIQTRGIGYLLDNNGDGIYDAFYSDELQQTLTIQKKDGSYNIDSDGDEDWDYTYNATNGLTDYVKPPNTPGFENVLFIGAVIAAVICGIIVTVVLWKKKRIV